MVWLVTSTSNRTRHTVVAAVATLATLLAVGAVGGALYYTAVKSSELPAPRASVVLYADGSPLARMGLPGANQGLTRPTGLVVMQVVKELAAHGITQNDIETKGYTIRTTIEAKAQRDAEAAVAAKMKGQQQGLDAALVAVRPGTGEVVAYYGGSDGTGSDAASSPHQPGSSFAIYPLEAALENGISVKSLWNGNSSERFADRASGSVDNADGTSCQDAGTRGGQDVCTLYQATVMSLNTVYYALAEKLGRVRILQAAKDSGVSTLVPTSGGDCHARESIQLQQLTAQQAAETCGIGNEVSFGQNPVTPLDQASGYATVAANGTATTEHFVTKVVAANGTTVYRSKTSRTRAFSAHTAADLDWTMRKDATRPNMKLADGRPQATKTGDWQYGNSTNQNADAWMCGYVPQLASVVWIGHDWNAAPIYYNNDPNQEMFGSELPSDIWSAFMDAALKDLNIPSQDFPAPAFTGSSTAGQF
jgi:membrane peptidoglycan carboxypeptidase